MVLKSRTSVWLAIVITALAGALFIVWHTKVDVLSWFVVALGILLVAPATYILIDALGSLKPKTRTDENGEEKPVRMPFRQRFMAGALILVSVCTIALGLWMIFNPGFFKSFMAFLFGTVLAVYGVYMVLLCTYMVRPWHAPAWTFLVPAAMIVMGLIIILTPLHNVSNESKVMLITGIMLLLAAVNWGALRIMMPSDIDSLRKSDKDSDKKDSDKKDDNKKDDGKNPKVIKFDDSI